MAKKKLRVRFLQPAVSLLFEDAPDEPEHFHRFAVVPSTAQGVALVVAWRSKWSLNSSDAYYSIESLLCLGNA